MSLNKAIESGKERRKPYRGGGAVSGHCANHNPRKGVQCPACVGNRTHKNRKRHLSSEDQL